MLTNLNVVISLFIDRFFKRLLILETAFYKLRLGPYGRCHGLLWYLSTVIESVAFQTVLTPVLFVIRADGMNEQALARCTAANCWICCVTTQSF
jgi:hypothetical protein